LSKKQIGADPQGVSMKSLCRFCGVELSGGSGECLACYPARRVRCDACRDAHGNRRPGVRCPRLGCDEGWLLLERPEEVRRLLPW
jgi:hypothetical protein